MNVCALAVGGLDPSGGAGVIADARAFEIAGAFPCAIAATLTVQSTLRLVASHPVLPETVRAQLDEIAAHQNVMAVKIGALGSAQNVGLLADFLSKFRLLPMVLDPVFLPTHGEGRLLAADGVAQVREQLVPRATLVTANASEAAELTGRRVRSLSEAREAARALVALGAYAALVKGGHLDERDAVDCLAVADDCIDLRESRLAIGDVHGTGCTLAALIAGRLAVARFAEENDAARRHSALQEAVQWGRNMHRAMLQEAVSIGKGASVLRRRRV